MWRRPPRAIGRLRREAGHPARRADIAAELQTGEKIRLSLGREDGVMIGARARPVLLRRNGGEVGVRDDGVHVGSLPVMSTGRGEGSGGV